ncbi:MAG: hypothetical protein KGD58_07855 [Candidatus Lokiarchaeota archaeon]|nr:hypothetical protein [Candidatus Lokiarchaeota archaeon]
MSIAFGIIGDVLAYIFFPNFNILRRAVSSLCKGKGGLFFQIGSVISGIFAIPFVVYLNKSFNKEYVKEDLKRKALITALISCSCLIILGAFCGSNPIVAVIHGVSAVISWLFGLFYITFFNIFMLRDPKYSRSLSIIGFCATFSLSLLMILFFLAFIPSIRFLVIILPSIEWINTIIIILWYLIISLYTLKNRIS